MLGRTHTFLIALVALSCTVAFAHRATVTAATKDAESTATPKRLPFEPDEQLTYEGEFSKLLLRGINIAEFKFSVERAKTPAAAAANSERAEGAAAPPPNLIFKGDVVARGWFRKLFGIDFRYNTESVVEPTSFLILSNSTRDEQGKRLRTSEAVFDRTHNTLTWTLRNPNDPQSQPRVVTAPLQNAAHDLISAIYFLRTQPLEPGRNLELVISDSGAVYRIPVKVGARKRMKTVVGRVQAVRVDIEIFGAERLVDREGEMTLWITDDSRRLPVRARVNTDIGTLDINLKKVSGGNVPASSR
ncbi:MAG TPA: DUF3108 domain-containing protein [Pyrinomonadaceae bacterium]|jgi:hypothetical protein|nr:DUF3108 domain-containing protein [Pyrinomonadaceae bacterium]